MCRYQRAAFKAALFYVLMETSDVFNAVVIMNYDVEEPHLIERLYDTRATSESVDICDQNFSIALMKPLL